MTGPRSRAWRHGTSASSSGGDEPDAEGVEGECHAPAAEAGTEFIQFSPSDQLQEVEAAMMRHMQQMQGA